MNNLIETLNKKLYKIDGMIEITSTLLKDLQMDAININKPIGYYKGTSYDIHDNIKGSKRTFDLFNLAEETEELNSCLTFFKYYKSVIEYKINLLQATGPLNDLELNIYILTRIYNMNLKDVAFKLDISYNYCKKLSSLINKKIEEDKK